jgi:hypothetical protein
MGKHLQLKSLVTAILRFEPIPSRFHFSNHNQLSKSYIFININNIAVRNSNQETKYDSPFFSGLNGQMVKVAVSKWNTVYLLLWVGTL